jgi:hypothetical protein
VEGFNDNEPERFECSPSDLVESIDGRPDTCVVPLSKLSCLSGPTLVLELDVCRRDLMYERTGFCCIGPEAAEDELFDHVADAGSFGGGMLLYLLVSSAAASTSFGSFFLRLSFLRRAEAENADSESDPFSTGLSVNAVLGVTEKLGARGPAGRGPVVRFSSVVKLGLMKLAKSSFLGNDEDTKGEIFLSCPKSSFSKLKLGRFGLPLSGDRRGSGLRA